MPKITITSLLWKHKQEIYVMLSKCWTLNGWVWGVGVGLIEYVNKRNILEKILLQIVLNQVLKCWEK